MVRAVPPTSAKPGDKAILTERGEFLGWVGGSCAEPTARRAARAALGDGQCRLIHLTNDETDLARPGVELAAMTCHSGGSLELYVEPHLPQPSLIVFGHSPIARALSELGGLMKYRVTQVTLAADAGGVDGIAPGARRLRNLSELAALGGRASYVVVASQGHSELEALGWALRSGASYVGLIASQRRSMEVRAQLSARGLDPDSVARLRAPAGLRLGASVPEEVALSVFSELVAARRAASSRPGEQPQGEAAEASISAAPPRAETARPGPERALAESCCGAAPAAEANPRAAPTGGCRAAAAPAGLRVSAIVLAAGLSQRMGAPNKLLLPVHGKPMIRHVLETVVEAGCAELVVVLGHQAAEVEAAIAPLGARSVVNQSFASGQVSSVRAGLGALRQRADAVMVCLGDQPLLTSADLRQAQAAFARRSHGTMLVPMCGEQRGNPVIIDWATAQETLARGSHFGCRHAMAEHPERVYYWQSQNEHFVRDIDQPADYQALLVGPPA